MAAGVPPPCGYQNLPPFTIAIKVRAGRKKSILKGLESMHNGIADMDVEMTWLEAFAHHFNVHVDPDKYLIQKGTTTVNAKLLRRHPLTEKIKVLISEYNTNRKTFLVTVLSNQHQRVRNGCEGSTKNGIGPREMMNPPSPPPKKMKVDEEGGQCQHQDDDTDTSDSSYLEEDNDGGDDTDKKSDITSISQLEEEVVGIPWEDIKSKMLHKIKNDYKNSDFLRAREEIRSLKEKGRWTRSLMTLPSVLNIAMDLFE